MRCSTNEARRIEEMGIRRRQDAPRLRRTCNNTAAIWRIRIAGLTMTEDNCPVSIAKGASAGGRWPACRNLANDASHPIWNRGMMSGN